MIITSDGNIPSKLAHSFNVMKMAQGFLEAGEDVELVSLLSYPNWKEKVKIRNIHKFYGISKNVKIKLLPVWNKDFFTKTIGARTFNDSAIKYFNSKHPNFVYCRSFISTALCVEYEIPVILETHTTNYEQEPLKKIYEIAKNESFLGIVTIHEKIKEEHVRRGIPADKILVLEDGVSLKQFNIQDDKRYWRKKLQLPLDKNIIMYSGGLYKEKGIEDILLTAESFSNLKKNMFIIAGGNNEQIKYWEKYCSDKKISNVNFVGFIPNSSIPHYLKSADILIMPYPKNIDYKVMDINSTSPLKLFEYMASKRPIITSDIPVIKKILKNNESVLLTKPGDITELINACNKLVNDSELGYKLSNNAFEIVKKFDWKDRGEKIANYFIKKYD